MLMLKLINGMRFLGTVALFLVPLSSYAAEDDLYDFLWLDPDKKVYVLQNKVYEKKKTIYANLGYISTLTGEYQSTKGFHFSSGYYFTEEWALEVKYNGYSSSNNDAYENLQRINQSVPFIRRAKSSYGALAVYSPFYGKINTFNKIIYFDWSFGVGLGQITTESNAKTVSNPSQADQYEQETNMAILTKTALRVHITKNIHLGIDYQRDNYQAPGPTINSRAGTNKWRNNSDVIISIGFSF